MCGLGVPVGCRMKHAKGLFKQPIEAIDVWPRGGCWLQDEACQVSVLRVLRFLSVWSVWRV